MPTPAEELKNVLVAKFTVKRQQGSDQFFQEVLNELPKHGGVQLGDKPFPVDGGWLVLAAVFRSNNQQSFFFAIFNAEKQAFGLAVDNDPNCPEWLVNMAEVMVKVQDTALAHNQGGVPTLSTLRN